MPPLFPSPGVARLEDRLVVDPISRRGNFHQILDLAIKDIDPCDAGAADPPLIADVEPQSSRV